MGRDMRIGTAPGPTLSLPALETTGTGFPGHRMSTHGTAPGGCPGAAEIQGNVVGSELPGGCITHESRRLDRQHGQARTATARDAASARCEACATPADSRRG